MNCFSITFIAQNCPSLKLRTKYTLLKPPMARHFSTWYFFKRPSPTNYIQLKLSFSASRVPYPMEMRQSSSKSRCADSNPTTRAVLKRGLLSLLSSKKRQISWWKRKGMCQVYIPTGRRTFSAFDLQFSVTVKVVGEGVMTGGEGQRSRKCLSVQGQACEARYDDFDLWNKDFWVFDFDISKLLNRPTNT